MPEISRFFGIVISIYFRDHSPPHFHVRYNEFEAKIGITNLEFISGYLPPKALGLIMEWAIQHKSELLENWNNIQAGKTWKKIESL